MKILGTKVNAVEVAATLTVGGYLMTQLASYMQSDPQHPYQPTEVDYAINAMAATGLWTVAKTVFAGAKQLGVSLGLRAPDAESEVDAPRRMKHQ